MMGCYHATAGMRVAGRVSDGVAKLRSVGLSVGFQTLGQCRTNLPSCLGVHRCCDVGLWPKYPAITVVIIDRTLTQHAVRCLGAVSTQRATLRCACPCVMYTGRPNGGRHVHCRRGDVACRFDFYRQFLAWKRGFWGSLTTGFSPWWNH